MSSPGIADASKVVDLRLKGEDAKDRAEHAATGLRVVADCYRRAMSEPIPMFANLTWGIFHGVADERDWTSGSFANPYGPGVRPQTVRALGSLTFEEVVAIPAGSPDPPGTAHSRVARYADVLWDAFLSTTVGVW